MKEEEGGDTFAFHISFVKLLIILMFYMFYVIVLIACCPAPIGQ